MIIGVNVSHDASSCLIDDNGNIIYAIEEERITRNKHQDGFPYHGVAQCFKIAQKMGESPKDIEIASSWDVSLKNLFKGFFKEYTHYLNRPGIIFSGALSLPNTYKYFNPKIKNKLFAYSHHQAHTASAYFKSPLKNAYDFVCDGRGEYQTMSLWKDFKNLKETNIPHSLGWFYSGITELLGFTPNNDEYKVMGLASYGRPACLSSMQKFFKLNGEDAKISINNFRYQPTFRRILKRIGVINKVPKTTIYSSLMKKKLKGYKKEDVASSAQKHFENILLEYLLKMSSKYNTDSFNLSGGSFLNVVANKVLKDNKLKIFPVPYCHDAGTSIGAALLHLNKKKNIIKKPLTNVYFGNEFTNEEIKKALIKNKLKYKKSPHIEKEVAELIERGNVIGWFQGRDEFGPRALGNRSILANPKDVKFRDRVNKVIKFREIWRPFCPSMLYEARKEYLINPEEAPFMIMGFDVPEEKKKEIPAVVHVNGTTRPQTVKKTINPKYHEMIKEFEKVSGVPVVMNTSFNRRGEPIVHTPQNAIDCFLGSDMDVLAIGDFLVKKNKIK